MISELKFTVGKPSVVPWWETVPFLKGRKSPLSFTDGLNIIFGPNGSGKSTVLTAIAQMLHASQGGFSIVTETSVRAVWEHKDWNTNAKAHLKDGVMPVHDGQAIAYMNPSSPAGLVGGQFDDDFLEKGLTSIRLRRLSAGQNIRYLLNEAFKESRERSEIVYKVNKTCVNDIWKEAIEFVEESLKPMIPKGKVTVVLDEPDRSLDFPYQEEFWGGASKLTRAQAIVATHSPFALFIEGANYIETEAGYLEKCRKALKGLK